VCVVPLTPARSPWQPEFCNWAFNLERGSACLPEKWAHIPDTVDVLITHGPPSGHGDWVSNCAHAGCCDLLNTIEQRVRPKYHVFGHVHEGYGVTTNGHTVFVNASTCTFNYQASNPAVVFDLPPPGSEDFRDWSVHTGGGTVVEAATAAAAASATVPAAAATAPATAPATATSDGTAVPPDVSMAATERRLVCSFCTTKVCHSHPFGAGLPYFFYPVWFRCHWRGTQRTPLSFG
jgi:hypothetical protein